MYRHASRYRISLECEVGLSGVMKSLSVALSAGVVTRRVGVKSVSASSVSNMSSSAVQYPRWVEVSVSDLQRWQVGSLFGKRL